MTSDNADLIHRLTQFRDENPDLNVFDIAERERQEAAKSGKQLTPMLQEIMACWPEPLPRFMAPRQRNYEYHHNYPTGPRSTYPIDRLHVEKIVDEWNVDELLALLPTEAKKIVLVHPRIFWDELAEPKIKPILDAFTQRGIQCETLSLSKLPDSATRRRPVDKNDTPAGVLQGVRFAADSSVPKDADIYVIVDHLIVGGRTLEAMKSFLLEHLNNPQEKKIFVLCGGNAKRHPDASGMVELAAQQRPFRARHPLAAARCDVMLDMMGIGGLNALTPQERAEFNWEGAPEVIEEGIKTMLARCRNLPESPHYGNESGWVKS